MTARFSVPLWMKSNNYADGLVQDCCNSIANALQLLQYCTEPSMWHSRHLADAAWFIHTQKVDWEQFHHVDTVMNHMHITYVLLGDLVLPDDDIIVTLLDDTQIRAMWICSQTPISTLWIICKEPINCVFPKNTHTQKLCKFQVEMKICGNQIMNLVWDTFCGIATVYPKKYAHGFGVLCFVVVTQSFIMNSHEVSIYIHQGCFAGTGAIVRLPQCQWSKPDGYGKISQCITTTKHSKAKTVCIFLRIYCKLSLDRAQFKKSSRGYTGFKYAVRFVQKNTEMLWAEDLVTKFYSKNVKCAWKNVEHCHTNQYQTQHKMPQIILAYCHTQRLIGVLAIFMLQWYFGCTQYIAKWSIPYRLKMVSAHCMLHIFLVTSVRTAMMS